MFKSTHAGTRPEAAPSFFWHDYETTGPVASLDRPSQFAGIRTDMDLNEIGDPVLVYCKPAADLLPNPRAVVLTGITPQLMAENGLDEAAFADVVLKELSVPGTCAVGYNSIRFDDEVGRHLFYRNFRPVYDREWQNNNSRWDAIGLLRLVHLLRPDVLVWPVNDKGEVTFRLEDLATLNHVRNGQAHDALSDVRATIALVRKVRDAAPDLFQELFSFRTKKAVIRLVEEAVTSKVPLLHASANYGSKTACVALVTPLFFHPARPQVAVMVNLNGDVDTLVSLSEEELLTRFGKKLEEGEDRLPVQLIPANRAPALLSARWLKGVDLTKTGFDIRLAGQQAKKLADPAFQARFSRVLETVAARQEQEGHGEEDADLALYSGFPSKDEEALIGKVRAASPEELKTLHFVDPDPATPPGPSATRHETLLFRYRARNFPESLNPIEQQLWRAHCKKRLTKDNTPGLTLAAFGACVDEEEQNGADPALVSALRDWAVKIESSTRQTPLLSASPRSRTPD